MIDKKKDILEGEIENIDELVNIDNLETIYGTHIFKLKYDTLLETKLNSTPLQDKSKLKELKDSLLSIEEKLDLTYLEATKYLKPINLPTNLIEGEECYTNYKEIQYTVLKPKRIYVVGSHNLSTNLTVNDTLDLVVEIPDGLFKEKDYKNNIYFYKRSFYLACLVKHLQKKKNFLDAELQFENINNLVSNNKKPNLSIRFKDSGLKVRIILGYGNECEINRLKLKPNNSNNKFKQSDQKETEPIPTPYYNSQILADSLYLPHLTYLGNVKSQCDGFTVAVKLAKLYLKLRGIGATGINTTFRYLNDLNGFVISMLVAYVIEQKQLFNCLPYQIFKVWLEFLATHPFEQTPIILGQQTDVAGFSIPDFQAKFTILMLDPTGFINFTPNLSLTQWTYLKQLANFSTLKIVNQDMDLFEHLFLVDQASPSLNFDEIFTFQIPTNLTNPFYTLEEKVNVGDKFVVLNGKVERFVIRALTSRIHSVIVINQPNLAWSVDGPCKRYSQLKFGLQIDHANSTKNLVLGPKSDQHLEAKKFRQLFGKFAELRKFKDGSIHEAVLLNAKSDKVAKSFNPTILKLLFDLHLQSKLELQSDDLTDLIPKPLSLSSSKYVGFYEQLFNDIKSFTLPLQVQNLLSTDAKLRSTDFNGLLGGDRPIPITIQFERFTEWPTQLLPLQMTKTTLLLELGKKLEATKKYRSQIIIPSMTETLEIYPAPQLEVQLLKGVKGDTIKFLVEIYVETELDIIAQFEQDNLNPIPELDFNDKLEAAVNCKKTSLIEKFNYQLLHHRLVDKFIKLNPTVVLTINVVKSWLAYHHLLAPERISEELVELLAIYLEVNDKGVGKKNQSNNRSLVNTLQLLVNHDFLKEGPLLINSKDTNTNTEAANYCVNHQQHQEYLTKHPIHTATPSSKNYPVLMVDDTHLKFNRWKKLKVEGATFKLFLKLARATLKTSEGDASGVRKGFVCPTSTLFQFKLQLDTQFIVQGEEVLGKDESSAKRQKRSLQEKEKADDGEEQHLPISLTNLNKFDMWLQELKVRYRPYLSFHLNPLTLQALYIQVNTYTFHLNQNSKLNSYLGLPKEVGNGAKVELDLSLEEVLTSWVEEIARIGQPFVTGLEKL